MEADAVVDLAASMTEDAELVGADLANNCNPATHFKKIASAIFFILKSREILRLLLNLPSFFKEGLRVIFFYFKILLNPPLKKGGLHLINFRANESVIPAI